MARCRFRTLDPAGNSTSGTGHGYTLDTTAPSGGTPDLAAGSDSGLSNSDNITNVLAPTFTVSLGSSVAVGDTVQLLLNGSPLSHPLVHSVSSADLTAQSISFTVSPGDLGPDGIKPISATFTDAAGNSTTGLALSVTLDTSAPQVRSAMPVATPTRRRRRSPAPSILRMSAPRSRCWMARFPRVAALFKATAAGARASRSTAAAIT